nr:immunoglobulin light chain junction region [Macaca mulatta]MOW42064.1 immunoglobulin light chain junction region [Macaca mulatta]MOW44266.1 immunoglobulin light chain junction region [Macaca mulatta]
CQQYYIDPNTF